jgi:glyoxylase-like metal-dependent hydrolase (beta-lactamase superfamily II)
VDGADQRYGDALEHWLALGGADLEERAEEVVAEVAPGVVRRARVLEVLPRVEPDDVDAVVCSHLHPDHCGCNAFFRKATIICHAKELAAARAPDAAMQGYIAADWDQPMPFREIDGQHDLFDDGRIVLIPVPGHTPGTVAALVGLDRSGSFLLASDSVGLRLHLEREVIPKNTWNADQALASLAEIKRIEAGGATVLCGHDAAQWATLRKGADAYD